MPYVRTVKTKSGATAAQVVWSSRRGSRSIEHIGSARGEAELEALKAAARQKIAAGQPELDLGPQAGGPGGPLPVTSTRTGHLLDALDRGYRVLGLDEAAGGDEVFRLLVAARVIEPASKLDSLRVLEEAGIAPPSYATVKRRLPAYAKEEWRQRLSEACAGHARLGPASLVPPHVAVWRSVRAHGETKTERSRRTLGLPAAAVQALRAWADGQAAERLAAGDGWQDTELVFTNHLGAALDAGNVRKMFKRVCEAAGVGSGWTPRELRTTFVSLLSHRGVSIEEIARLAGHASTRTTEVVYRRELRPVITTGAEIMDELFTGS